MPYNVGYKEEDAYTRHRRWIKEYEMFYSNGKVPPPPRTRTELEVLQQHHQFLRDNNPDDDDDDDRKGKTGASKSELSWEDQLSLKWYNKLFREFAVVDLKHYKSSQGIKLRWRTEDEVLERIGELTCGSLRCKNHLPKSRSSRSSSRHRKHHRENSSPSPSSPPSRLSGGEDEDARRPVSSSRPRTRTRSRSPPLRRDNRQDQRRRRDEIYYAEKARRSDRSHEEEELKEEENNSEEEELPLVPVPLTAFQLDFAYEEQGKNKQALVKCVLCHKCGRKLEKSYKFSES